MDLPVGSRDVSDLQDWLGCHSSAWWQQPLPQSSSPRSWQRRMANRQPPSQLPEQEVRMPVAALPAGDCLSTHAAHCIDRLPAGGNGILTIGPPEATAFYTSRFDPGLLSFRAGKRCRSSDGPRVRIRCTEPPTIAFYGQNLSQATKAGGDADARDEQAALLE
jgi:hypothetical protein